MALQFAPQLAFHGFDTHAKPKWQMVPFGGQRVLTVTGAAGLDLRVLDPAVVDARQTMVGGVATLTLRGVKPGKTAVEWIKPGVSAKPATRGFRLDISVKRERQVRTAFFYVDDGRKQKTVRKIADLPDLVLQANTILLLQANVLIVQRSAATLPVKLNLGKVVRFSAHLTGAPDKIPIAQHEWDDLLKLRDKAANLNVFFVKEYEDDNTPFVDSAEAGTLAGEKMCVFEDSLGHPDHEVLAHEAVHALGVSGHVPDATYLMAVGDKGIGRFISRAQSNKINPSGT